MSASEVLQSMIDQQTSRLRAGLPANRPAAILAIIRQLAKQPAGPPADPVPDLVTGRRIANLGGNKALQLCVDPAGQAASAAAPDDDWAERFIDECRRLSEAELILRHCETGFMKLVATGDASFDAWIATRSPPASWQERAALDGWADWLTRQQQPANQATANRISQTMANQLSYPLDATIGGQTIRLYRDVLERVLALAQAAPGDIIYSMRDLADRLATVLPAGPAAIKAMLEVFTLDSENAGYHAAVPGIASPPLVRVDDDRLAISPFGLAGEPLLFHLRELRRRYSQDYHNSAHLRENVFRADLYELFGDKRFVTSSTRIELRRESGRVRTDVDAVVFDRKTGTLGIFEMKSQDPFARSTAELSRQRDNLLYANRQLSGVLAWLQQNGLNELLNRVDSRTAKKFRAHKVYPFVLGRYFAHPSDGPAPDSRAAWGTWPQLLRWRDSQPSIAPASNPIASLSAYLTKDNPTVQLPPDIGKQTISLGTVSVNVYPSYAAHQVMDR
jgi:hypothetical protein